MTYIVSVTHFCEVHGPSMIMCTQAVNNPDTLSDYYSPQLPEAQFCQSCIFQIPNPGKNADDVSPSSSVTDLGKTPPSEGSGSLINEPEFESSRTTLTLEDQISSLLNSTNDSKRQKRRPVTLKTQSSRNPNTFFVSTQFPTNTDVYSSLRQIIVKLFTAETNADSTKPVVFGNSKHGYSVALTFSLVDKTARGSERKYAIIVTSNWEIDLFSNYTFILTNLNQMVRRILITGQQIQAKAAAPIEAISNNDFYLRRSAGLPKAKSMTEILQDYKLFLKLHMWASLMLDALEDTKHV